jgi:hypothetical protein
MSDSVDVISLRRELADFLGKADFQTFVKQVFRRERLVFWQEKKWGQFVAEHPEYAISFSALKVALRVCHLHGDELQPTWLNVTRDEFDYSDEYSDALVNLFPFESTGPIMIGEQQIPGGKIADWYCPSCRIAKKDWEEKKIGLRQSNDVTGE